MLIGIEKVLQKEEPAVVLVEGDTNTVLAGALAGRAKLGVKVGHVEAGLPVMTVRCLKKSTRVLADHCSDYLFAPTEKSKQILLNEGIAENKVSVVQNTIVDAVNQNLAISANTRILDQLGLEKDGFMLTTSHRQENVDDQKRFTDLIKGLQLVQREFKVPLVYPIPSRS